MTGLGRWQRTKKTLRDWLGSWSNVKKNENAFLQNLLLITGLQGLVIAVLGLLGFIYASFRCYPTGLAVVIVLTGGVILSICGVLYSYHNKGNS